LRPHGLQTLRCTEIRTADGFNILQTCILQLRSAQVSKIQLSISESCADAAAPAHHRPSEIGTSQADSIE
jgi:hypothetical protein